MDKLVGVEDADAVELAVLDAVREAVDAPAAVAEEIEVGMEVSDERSNLKND